MTLSMSSWGNDSKALGLEVSVREEPPRSFPDPTTGVMPFKKSNRYPVGGGKVYNYRYSLSNPPANVGKHRFRVRAPVCDSPDLPSCLRKNHSVADHYSGHALVSTSHLPLVSMYDGGQYPKVTELISWITSTHHARAEIENSENGEMSNTFMLSPWETCNTCNSLSWNLDRGEMIKDANIRSALRTAKEARNARSRFARESCSLRGDRLGTG